MKKVALSAICVCFVALSVVQAQDIYLATLNKNDGSILQRTYLPGISLVTLDDFINPTFDENHQRYIFVGESTNPQPGATGFNLYTVDVQTGAILDSPGLTFNGMGAYYIQGLQYDNGTDTLYTVYEDQNGQSFFCWVDLSTGVIHTKNLLPGTWTLLETSFDTRDNLYIMTNASQMLVLNASSGTILYNYSFGANTGIINMFYDNLNGKLYGVGPDPNPGYTQFDSITLATGVLHPLAQIENYGYPQIFVFTIDEQAGKYLFTGANNYGQGCMLDTFYVLDVNTGSILSLANNPNAVYLLPGIKEYVMNYCLDNQTGTLYALDWHPPLAAISTSATNTCSRATDTFKVSKINTGIYPVAYQWQVNGNNVGTNDSVFTSSSLANGDSVSCLIEIVSGCIQSDTFQSVKVPVQVHSGGLSSVSIVASASTICSGDTVIFVATPVNGGPLPSYQWQIDGANTGTDRSSFSCTTLHNGDSVDCIMTADTACSLPVQSNKLATLVDPAPVLQIGNNMVITPGSSVRLDPSVTGTPIDSYQWTPAAGLSDPSIVDPVASPATSTTYQLTVEADDGCKVSAKISILVYYHLEMPGAFTPNGDGNNDIFRIPASIPVQIKSFSVFNRWGQPVFITANPASGWDGRLNGHPQPGGVYIWEIEYVDLLTRKPAVSTGTVVLVR